MSGTMSANNEHGLLGQQTGRVSPLSAAPKARPNPGEGDTSSGSFSEGPKPAHWFDSNTDGYTTGQDT